MEAIILKSEKGGYNKNSVLTKIDAYNVLLLMAENGQLERDKLIAEFENAEKMELKREKSGFFGKSGFSVEDTDAYIARLEAEIKSML